jgi:hypothetical protein
LGSTNNNNIKRTLTLTIPGLGSTNNNNIKRTLTLTIPGLGSTNNNNIKQISKQFTGVMGGGGSVIVFNATFNSIFSYIVAVSSIGGENRRKPPTCRKSLTNFIT